MIFWKVWTRIVTIVEKIKGKIELYSEKVKRLNSFSNAYDWLVPSI